MVAEIKHPRESSACMADLFPRSILHLVTEKILNAASDAKGIGHPRRHESHDGPGRLRRCTVPLPAPRRVIAIGKTGFAPPAIGSLLRLKPGTCTANVGFWEIPSDHKEASQD